MRLAATVYIGELYEENVEKVSRRTLTQIFPPRDRKRLTAQEARHWQRPHSEYVHRNTMKGDAGRRAFRKDDSDEDCEDREEEGMCESGVEGTRKRCPLSCGVYIQEGPTNITRVDETRVNICTQNRTGMETCRVYEDDATIAGDFVTPDLQPGEMFPIVWRSDAKRVTDYAFQIGVPPELTAVLLNYADELGVTESLRELTGSRPLSLNADGRYGYKFQRLSDGRDWYVQRPPTKWRSNMHWISPADEATHEEYLRVLAAVTSTPSWTRSAPASAWRDWRRTTSLS